MFEMVVHLMPKPDGDVLVNHVQLRPSLGEDLTITFYGYPGTSARHLETVTVLTPLACQAYLYAVIQYNWLPKH